MTGTCARTKLLVFSLGVRWDDRARLTGPYMSNMLHLQFVDNPILLYERCCPSVASLEPLKGELEEGGGRGFRLLQATCRIVTLAWTAAALAGRRWQRWKRYAHRVRMPTRLEVLRWQHLIQERECECMRYAVPRQISQNLSPHSGAVSGETQGLHLRG